jgi:hypothetical protein
VAKLTAAAPFTFVLSPGNSPMYFYVTKGPVEFLQNFTKFFRFPVISNL